MENIERIKSTSFVLEIREYGDIVRQYNDNNRDRFLDVSKRIMDDHMHRSIKLGEHEVRNTQFHMYTY